MRLPGILLVLLILLALSPSTAPAGDFDWIRNLNIQAEADPSGFRARLGARFKIGDVEVNTVLSNVERPADAYMVLRLGEMTGRSTEHVLTRYRSGGGNGWGALAKSLGIKPGSREFHALKDGHDLQDHGHGRKGNGNAAGRGVEKTRGKRR